MILGTGIDIIEVERVATRMNRNSGLREMVFSKMEIAYCETKAAPFQHYSARFAAKEAFLKALGTGWETGLSFNEIEVSNEENGRPAIRLLGNTAQTLASMQIRHIHVSLSHLNAYATAIVILES